MPAAHNNHGLFSDHYLARHLPELSGEDLAQAQRDQQALREIYARGVPHAADGKEAACEQWLLRPVMEVLGFARFEKPPLPTEETTFEPDYALFASPEDIPEGAGDDPDAFYSAALAIAEAKRWDRDLGSAERDDDSASRRQHPGAQTRRYLFESGVRWGILTNGRLWRIYERERSRAGFRYYEVDLPALLEADVQDFRYFWLLFRRAAYRPDDSGQSPIGRVLDESRRYWLDITDRLRDRVYDALETLMTGMIEGSPALSEHDLPAVHEASLIVLYRLLFCFYAEARNLLPMSNPVYRHNHSAQTKLSEVAQRRDTSGGAWSHSGRALWQWFRDLSRIINEGDPGETGVPEYDGGLFDPQEWPLLSDPSVAVPDVHMAEVIDRIGRDWDRDTDERAFLDYSELTVRELGSIYEGLLEMRPHWRDGSVELLTDRGERKATGSYYTPEYIVDYIVTNTLDPLLTDAAAQVKDRLPGYEAQIAERERLIEDRGPDHPENAKTLRAIDDLKLELLEPYFELMVLDPAMGSGHFLVAASEEITEAIITDPSHRPPSEAADEDDENIYYKRRVVERCLYGVDLNPLAVELAKLSLWLHTVEFGKPLSFLKHHLREGNSLIGARLSEMRVLPSAKGKTKQDDGQLNLFTSKFMQEATNLLRAFSIIERMPTDTHRQKEDKQAAWEDIEQRRERFRQVANVWLSLFFGNDVPQMTYEALVLALDNPERFAEVSDAKWFVRAQALAKEHDFFHWELEFPDAFFTEQGPKGEKERGFDAVVGNPPWGVSLETSERVLQYGYEDSSEVFYTRGLELAHRSGLVGMVMPRGVLAVSRADFRQMLLSENKPLVLADIGPDWFTRHVRMSTVLLIAQRSNGVSEEDTVQVACLNREQRQAAQCGEAPLETVISGSASDFNAASVVDTELVLLPLATGHAGPFLGRVLASGLSVGSLTESSRGVEMSKSGLVVRCPKCGLWNLPPRATLYDKPGDKNCAHCGNEFEVGGLAELIEIVREQPEAGGTWRPYVDGDAMGRYRPLEYQHIDISREGIDYKPPETYKSPKVLIRETGVGVRAVLETEHAYCPRSVYIYHVNEHGKREGYDEAALTGILMSRTMLYIAYNLFGETDSAAAFAKLRKVQVDHLPVPSGSRELLSVISDCAATLSERGLAGQKLEDWTLEGAVFHLWDLDEDDITEIVSFFAHVHDNKTVRGAFPEGVAGNEADYVEMWHQGAERARRQID